jgi:hypothetical protein
VISRFIGPTVPPKRSYVGTWWLLPRVLAAHAPAEDADDVVAVRAGLAVCLRGDGFEFGEEVIHRRGA